MALLNGTNLRLYVSGGVVNCETSSTFSSSVETDRTICKDSPNGELTPGSITATITGSGLLELAGSGQNFIDLLTIHQNKTQIAFVWQATGGFAISGNAYITEMSGTGETEETATFDFSLEVDGDYTIG